MAWGCILRRLRFSLLVWKQQWQYLFSHHCLHLPSEVLLLSPPRLHLLRGPTAQVLRCRGTAVADTHLWEGLRNHGHRAFKTFRNPTLICVKAQSTSNWVALGWLAWCFPKEWGKGLCFPGQNPGLQSFNYFGPMPVNYSPSWLPVWGSGL